MKLIKFDVDVISAGGTQVFQAKISNEKFKQLKPYLDSQKKVNIFDILSNLEIDPNFVEEFIEVLSIEYNGCYDVEDITEK
jgi:hypothetical protein